LPARKADDVTPGKTSSPASLASSKLVRVLSDLDVAAGAASPGQFTGRLAQLIDFNDSISISNAHANVSTADFEPSGESPRVLREDFLRARSAMLQGVMRSFSPQSAAVRIRLPEPTPQAPQDPVTAYEPYQRFYAAHQRQIDLSSRKLQTQVRKTAAGLSPQLARLAALDSALGDPLGSWSRQCFAAAPSLLGKRFIQLHRQCCPAAGEPGSWPLLLQDFCTEMRESLLAEIDARLLPVLGLIEAVNEQIEPPDYDD
jgi:hypothetical protein